MSRIAYFYRKILRAWASGTLLEKSTRFLSTRISRPFEVLAGFLLLSTADKKLNVRDGFSDHRQRPDHRRSNPEHIQRIMAAYKKAKQAQEHAPQALQVRGLWSEWISVNYGKLIAVLEAGDAEQLSAMLENLFREPCTIGAGGYDSYLRYKSLLGSLYIKYVWSKYRNCLLSMDLDPRDVDFPNVGNQTGVYLDRKIISIETLRHAYHAVEMRNLLTDVPGAVCVEIGAGLGGQAFQSLQIGKNQISKYILFDIPEVAVLSSYFLLSAFPEKNIRLFGEGEISTSPDEAFDVAVFPHFCIQQLEDKSVDLFYNSCSFSEMDGASSREYLKVIEKSCRRYFLHDNHDVRLEFKETDGSISTNVIGSELLPDPALFKRIYKKPRVHGLPEDRPFIQYEYLYERIARPDVSS